MLWPLCCIGALVQALPFVTVWKTTVAHETITLPFSAPVNNLTVDWGDDYREILNGEVIGIHLYTLAGVYNVSITGNLTGFRFDSAGDAPKLMEIVSWGDGFIMDSTSGNAFAGCVNLQVSAPDSSQPVFVPGAMLVGMFMNTSFNSSLSWDLANVVSVAAMFMSAKNLNQPITFTNTLGVVSTAGMFQDAIAFNQPLTMQTNNVASMQAMFQGARSFNQQIAFDTSNVMYMIDMFNGASAFNQSINFNGSSLTRVDSMFSNTAVFNRPVTISQMDRVTNMNFMFQGASKFNQPVAFNTGNVRYMNNMFDGASEFNQAINFNGSSLLQVDYMFSNAVSFNRAVNLTNTLALTSTAGMFNSATAFNQPITFQTDNVTNMEFMFQQAKAFNQPLTFNTSKVQSMKQMFANTDAFNQSINFDATSLITVEYMFWWAFHFDCFVNLTNSFALTSTFGMFRNTGFFNSPISISTDNVINMSFMFAETMYFNQSVPFNTRNVRSMVSMFYSARGFNQPINFDATSLTDASWLVAAAVTFNSVVNLTNTSALTKAVAMFQNASVYDLSVTFRTDNVVDMKYMFQFATAYNQPISFQTDKVGNMTSMFLGATNFNQPVPFDTSQVQSMEQMFYNAIAFNQPINFNTTNLVFADSMFYGALAFNQPIQFNATSLASANSMFCGATAFNSTVDFASSMIATVLINTASMFEGATVFNQALSMKVTNVRNMSSMFKNASAFNRPLPWPSTDTRNVLSMASMFEDAVSFNQPINFQVDKLVTADNLLRGATSFNWPVVLLGSNNLTSMARMLANATAFSQIVNVSSTANVVSMKDMFMNSLGFEQDLRSWNVSKVTDCSNFCYWCGLPSFSMCVPCPTGQILSASGMDVCNCPPNEFNISTTQCAAVSVAPTSPAPTAGVPSATGESALCTLVQVGSALQVECISESSSPSPSSRGFLTGIISPLFNITHANDDNTSNEFVFTLPIDPQLFVSVGKITQPCESQQLSCEWQDPNTLEFLRSGCTVSKERVDMGSGVVGTECTCTHLTVFAIALRSELQLAPLCHAQEVDYVLMALYAILGVGLTMQVARILRSLLATRLASRSSGPRPVSSSSATSFSPPPAAVAAAQISIIQHSLMLLVCVLRIVYVATKPVVGSLAGLVALGLLPSAITLSLFIHLLLTWAGLQFATFEASPFARFRVPFVIMTLLVFAVVIVLTVLVGVAPEVDTVRDGSYVLAALYAIVCVLVLLSGLGMRKSISVVDALRATDWRVVFRCRLLVVTVGLSSCLFLVACLWVAAVQTDIVTSSAATLATTISFYVFDWLSLCVLMWLFSFGVKEVIETHQREVKEPPRSNRAPSSRSASASHRRDTSSRQDNSARNQAIEL